MNTQRLSIAAVLLLSFATAAFALTPSAVNVPIAGTVFGLPESVYFSGTARITVRPAESDVPGRPGAVVVEIDLGDLSGRGLSTGTVYSAGGQVHLTRRLLPKDAIETTLPFAVRGSAPTARTRTAVARFNLQYDMVSGVLTAATASLAAPN
ncbi:MAG: hypothetical protein ACJ78Z_16440 [Myxococcales bacterium]